ncbi:MAG: glycosyltransferase family 2 protein, partial [Polaromonas sp.]
MSSRSQITPTVSCVMPAFNEARNLGIVVPQTLAALQQLSPQVELIVVDDGSQDDTASVMQDLCAAHAHVMYMRLSRNFGKESALTAGLDATRGEVVILMDADGQHPTSLLPEMLSKWKQGADVVYAVRKTREDQSALQARLIGLFYKLINWGSHIDIPANA